MYRSFLFRLTLGFNQMARRSFHRNSTNCSPDDLKVLDFSSLWAGPLCSLFVVESGTQGLQKWSPEIKGYFWICDTKIVLCFK